MKGAKEDYATFKRDMNTKLEQADKQLKDLKDQVQTKGQEVSAKTMSDLERSRNELRAQIDELKDETQAGWSRTKARLAKSFDELNKKIQGALNK